MTVTELISSSRQLGDKELPLNLLDRFAFKPTSNNDRRLTDINLDFRTSIVEQLLHDFSKSDIRLIRRLFAEEMKCEIATRRHDNLYQLCYYLFEIGDLQDTFVIYEAKFNAKNMDVGCMLDREMITVGHEVDEVIKYVQQGFANNPALEIQYSGILAELNGLKDFPDYESTESYSKFIKGYFFGHYNVEQTNSSNGKGENKRQKPWWKFW